MERRGFLEFGAAALAAGVVAIVAGCSRTEAVPPRDGNQDTLWKLTVSTEKANEPLDLAYVKNTPAFYRDASYGKEDPNFKPKTGGG